MPGLGRVGSLPIPVPSVVGVSKISEGLIELSHASDKFFYQYPKDLSLGFSEGKLSFLASESLGSVSVTKMSRRLALVAGLHRSRLNNLIIGLSKGFSKSLYIVGVGYRAALDTKGCLTVHVGYSHPIKYKVPQGISIECPKNTELLVKGLDKQLLGAVVSDICKFRKYDPYKGKGIMLRGKFMVRKEAKKK